MSANWEPVFPATGKPTTIHMCFGLFSGGLRCHYRLCPLLATSETEGKRPKSTALSCIGGTMPLYHKLTFPDQLALTSKCARKEDQHWCDSACTIRLFADPGSEVLIRPRGRSSSRPCTARAESDPQSRP